MEMLPTYASLERQKPSREYTILIAILGALWLVLSVLGCSKQSQTGNVAETTSTTNTAPPPPANANATTDTAHMTDGNIMAELREADSAEIALGKLAMAKAKAPAVKSFAKMMVDDHTKLLKGDNELATKLNVMPTPPANDSNASHLTAEMSSLNSAANPNSFDTIYINNAVTDHTNVLAAVKGFEAEASSPQLKDALKSAEPIVQRHLDHAEAIQKDFSRQPMAMQSRNR